MAPVVPLILRQLPNFINYPFLLAAGDRPVPLPITNDLLGEAKSLELFVLQYRQSTDAQIKVAVRFAMDVYTSAQSLDLPDDAPQWANLLTAALRGLRNDVANVNAQVHVINQSLGGLGVLTHSSRQIRTKSQNAVLSAQNLHMLRVDPDLDVNGQPLLLPARFNGSTLRSLERMTGPDLDMALTAYGMTLPPGANLRVLDKARLLFRCLGGVEVRRVN